MAKCPYSWNSWYGTYFCSSPSNPTNTDGKKGRVVGSPNGREHIETFCLDNEVCDVCEYHPDYYKETELKEEVVVTFKESNYETVEQKEIKESSKELPKEFSDDTNRKEEKEPKYFCRYCGGKIPTDSRFCSYCGEKL
ncbi:DNA-directed RNA polymerase subunit RPC12/RpoP [Lysinibacillus composti]|uniref:Zinc-ribbon domain-containing protein n=1 Tax=Lysinibacillus composti TaxID=720633 RepID=A0A3N9UJM5_9BACI|nr:zinc-ribbon domain-containing protein [Lysinibacillus composti]MBM7607253.1 DNA-directed RNA polymerase subunit RPC12/RpoP [Lysinibacillus composti]RQW76170.1 zinc-ribbon domain-containing protein [Lysinibacillus composti]